MYFDLLFHCISCIFNDNILVRILSLVTQQRRCMRGGEGEKHCGRVFSPFISCCRVCKHSRQLAWSSLFLAVQTSSLLIPGLARSFHCNKLKPPVKFSRLSKLGTNVSKDLKQGTLQIVHAGNLQGCGISSSMAENFFIIGGSNNHKLTSVIQFMGVVLIYDERLYF